jgi:NADPH:quinone reductase-like Zn-dependent oxidoreductase
MSPFVRQKLGTFVAVTRQQDLLTLNELLETGAITPIVDRTYDLSDAPAALRHLTGGHPRGKIVLTVR